MSWSENSINKNQSADGFIKDFVELWAVEKQHLIAQSIKEYYHRIDLRNKNKVFIDIGCGPGLLALKDSGKTLVGSPMLALKMEEQFSKYIFCDNDTAYTNALKVRVNKHFPKENVLLLDGDINQVIDVLPTYLPRQQYGVENSALALIDTYSFNVHFETIKKLAEMDVDILMVNAFPRLEKDGPDFSKIKEWKLLDDFLGTSFSSIVGLNKIKTDEDLFMLVLKQYGTLLKKLGYTVTSTLHEYKPGIENSTYYQIMYCSKNQLFKKRQKTTSPANQQQLDLFQAKKGQ